MSHFPKRSSSTDPFMAEFEARIERLEAELAETRRVNAAWRALYVRSERVLHQIGRRLEDVLRGNAGDAATSSSRVLAVGERRR